MGSLLSSLLIAPRGEDRNVERGDFNTEVAESTESPKCGGIFREAAVSYASGATLDEVFGNFAEARGAVGVGCEFGDGFCGEVARNLVRAFEAVNSGVRGFLLGGVFAGSFPQGGGSFFDVENVVGDLKEEAEGFAEASEASNIFCRGTCA
jgi:hypothetical protein